MSSLQARSFTRPIGGGATHAARLDLLENYLAHHEDILRCAHLSLEWLARYAGVDYNSSRSEIAERVAARSNLNAHQLETLMRQCEDTINGEPIHWRQAIDLVRRLRAVERKLGLRMRSRDERQAAENI